MIAISYRREDSLPIAGRLYDRLQAKFGQQNVFMDFDSIPPGVDFREQIKQTIERSKLVIAVIGPRWLGEQSDSSRRIDDPADFVRLEIKYALEKGVPIIPLLIDNTLMPRPEKLPADIEGLAFRNALPLDSGLDFHQHVDRVVNGIERATGTIAAGDNSRASGVSGLHEGTERARWSSGRGRYLALGALVLLSIGAAAMVVLHLQSSRRSDGTNEKAAASMPAPTNASSSTTPSVSAAPSPSAPAVSAKGDSAIRPSTATKERPFENSIGMRFVPVTGARVLFSVWETRVRDFRAYTAATNYRQNGGILTIKIEPKNKTNVVTGAALDPNGSWERPGFTQTDFHPVVAVSWDEAKEFCVWLTKKERTEGLLTAQQEYRLPLDEEWSAAVGKVRYPWGDDWPPSNDAGNYLDEASIRSFGNSGYAQIPGDDGYRNTAPGGRYTPNALGLFDLGGNVFEWCEDHYRSRMNPPDILKKNPQYQAEQNQILALRPVRGGSWLVGDGDTARSDFRLPMPGLARINFVGFRCVLVLDNSSSSQLPAATPDAREDVAHTTPVISQQQLGKISMAGTWKGTVRYVNATEVIPHTVIVSPNQRNVATTWEGSVNPRPVSVSVRRNSNTIEWKFPMHRERSGRVTERWVCECALRLSDETHAEMTMISTWSMGPYVGKPLRGSATMKRQ